MNKAVLIGRLTKEPEIKYTQSGVAVVSFTIAVDRDFKSEDGEKQTDFINCVAWRQSAEFIANYLHQGDLLAVSGSLQQRSWQTQSGENRSVIELVIDTVKGLSPKKENKEENQQKKEPQKNEPIFDDGLPF